MSDDQCRALVTPDRSEDGWRRVAAGCGTEWRLRRENGEGFDLSL